MCNQNFLINIFFRSENLTSKVDDLEAKLVTLEESVEDKNNIISTNREEIRRLQAEMLGINKVYINTHF